MLCERRDPAVVAAVGRTRNTLICLEPTDIGIVIDGKAILDDRSNGASDTTAAKQSASSRFGGGISRMVLSIAWLNQPCTTEVKGLFRWRHSL